VTSNFERSEAAPCKDDAAQLFSFWQAARDGIVQRMLHCQRSIGPDRVTAPLAVYVAPPSWHRPEYLFVQHGSYQLVRTEDQPRPGDPRLPGRGCFARSMTGAADSVKNLGVVVVGAERGF
jgi:hypothetical protein